MNHSNNWDWLTSANRTNVVLAVAGTATGAVGKVASLPDPMILAGYITGIGFALILVWARFNSERVRAFKEMEEARSVSLTEKLEHSQRQLAEALARDVSRDIEVRTLRGEVSSVSDSLTQFAKAVLDHEDRTREEGRPSSPTA